MIYLIYFNHADGHKGRLESIAKLLLPSFDINTNQLIRNKQTKPLILDNSGFISWSHTTTLGAIAISKTHAIGVDCELIREIDFAKISDRFLPREDIKNKESFYQKWTEKEANCKLNNQSIWEGMSSPTLGHKYSLKIGNCMLSIVSNNKAPVVTINGAVHYEI